MGAKYGFGKPTVVADAGLLSKDNIKKLIDGGYTFIIGARIKNETNAMKAQILAERETLTDGDATILKKADHTRLVVSFSKKRERKDAHMREKGLKRLRAKIATGKLTKAHINDRGYNKFLTMEGEVVVAINDAKIVEDARWDGLKGYATNTTLSPKEVIAAYGNLWQIEKAFRISKTDLRVRPIFHRVRRRIEAHLCIAFVAYTIWKELERLLKKHTCAMSPERAAELARTIYALTYTLPQTKEERIKLFRLSDEQEILKRAVDKSRKSSFRVSQC
jgi:transposase